MKSIIWQKKNVMYNQEGKDRRNTLLLLNAPSSKSWRISNKNNEKSIENLLRLYLGETKEDLSSTKRLHCCPRGNGGSKSTGCKVGLRQASTRGHVNRRGFGRRALFITWFVYYLKAVAFIGLRGHGRGGKRRRRGELSLVAAALSKIDAGVALLVREVGVALIFCFYSGYVYLLLSLLRGAFTLSKSDASPQ